MYYGEQVTALSLRSNTATQTVVFRCEGLAGWFDEEAGNHDTAAHLLGGNEHVFQTETLDGVTVLRDDCKVQFTIYNQLLMEISMFTLLLI